MIFSFAPLSRDDARILILGSIPGRKSLELGQYYGHPQNAFWKIMRDLFGEPTSESYPDRCAKLLDSHVALWDVLQAADREGSLDSSIKRSTEIPNDIFGFLGAHPFVDHVFCNGAKAMASFSRYRSIHHSALPARTGELVVVQLPSTSPAHAAMSYDEKLEAWRQVAVAADPRRPFQ